MKVELQLFTGTTLAVTDHPKSSQVVAPEGALTSLVGSVSRSDLSRPGRAGVIPGARKAGAISTTVSFLLHDDGPVDLETLWLDFRRGWSASRPSWIRVGGWSLRVFLDGMIAGPQVFPGAVSSVTVDVPIFAPDGVFFSGMFTATGDVVVTNYGDVPVWPDLHWKGSGGTVTTPSGATFTLPATGTSRSINLDPLELRLEGALGECVMPGKSGRWILPDGASLSWRTAVLDPWTWEG